MTLIFGKHNPTCIFLDLCFFPLSNPFLPLPQPHGTSTGGFSHPFSCASKASNHSRLAPAARSSKSRSEKKSLALETLRSSTLLGQVNSLQRVLFFCSFVFSVYF